MQRVKTRAPAAFKAQVDDAERRLNILFDHLNNEDLLKPNTIEDMANLARAIQQRDFNAALAIHVDIMTNRTDECGNWMVSEPCSYKLGTVANKYTGRCEAID
jgi:protein transport protein SEC31